MCPECEVPMLIIEYEGIEIDYCVDCHGIWLDEGELEAICEWAEVPHGHITQAALEAQAARRDEKQCPRCASKMDVVRVQHQRDSSVIELDRCPKRHGIWFNPGELQALIQHTDDRQEKVLAEFFSSIFQNDLAIDKKGE